MAKPRKSSLLSRLRVVDRIASKEKPERKRRYNIYGIKISETGGTLYICKKYFEGIASRLGHEPEWFRREKGSRIFVRDEINLFRYVGRENNVLVLGVSDFEIGNISKTDPRQRKTLNFLTYSLRNYDLNKLESNVNSCIPTEAVLLRDLKQDYDIMWI